MSESGAMTGEERAAFLAAVRVGVLSVDAPGRGPHALLRAAGRASLTVQTEAAPYQYVSVEGPVVSDPAMHDELAMASRCLGPDLGAWYVGETRGPTIR